MLTWKTLEAMMERFFQIIRPIAALRGKPEQSHFHGLRTGNGIRDGNGNNIGDGTPISVKVRKQIDTSNWDETTTFSDSLGRAIETQAKDSQGDVFTETKYDFLGRVKWTSNPYRAGDARYWSR